MTSREETKAKYEIAVFVDFAGRACLPVDADSIRSGDPNQNEPDVLYCLVSGEEKAIELGRLRDGILSAVQNRREPINGEYVRTCDPSGEIARKKLGKEYQVSCDIDLLLYKEHPIGTPDNVIVPTIVKECSEIDHIYERIWFMGTEVHKIYEKS